MKKAVSRVLARRIIKLTTEKGHYPPPIEGVQAMVEQKTWWKIMFLLVKSFLLIPLQEIWQGLTVLRERERSKWKG